MKVGDHFVILVGKHIELVCLTIATGEGWVRGQVVNGAWEFNYDLTTGSADYWTPSGHEVRLGWNLWCPTLPPKLDWYAYNEVIAYLEALMQKPAAVRWAVIQKNRATRWLNDKTRRLRRATTAFKKAWASDGRERSAYDDGDDITF